jgi:hypothetical protein
VYQVAFDIILATPGLRTTALTPDHILDRKYDPIFDLES